jgi:hypothetical protein
MDFYTILAQVLALLRQRGRVSYRALKRQFGLDDDALAGLALFYSVRAEHQTAREVAEQLLTIAQDQPDPVFRLQAHTILEAILFYLGELTAAQAQAVPGPAGCRPRVAGPDLWLVHRGV